MRPTLPALLALSLSLRAARGRKWLARFSATPSSIAPSIPAGSAKRPRPLRCRRTNASLAPLGWAVAAEARSLGRVLLIPRARHTRQLLRHALARAGSAERGGRARVGQVDQGWIAE
jgi:hypothetical protein